MTDKQKILIVDDKKENLLALRKALCKIDAEFIEASNGNEALAATLHHNFAVALLDVQMPGMTGYELAEHLRGDERTQVIPIVFLTASYDDDVHMFKGYEVGAVDYIMKPFLPEMLEGKVKALLEISFYRQALEKSEKKYRNLIEATRTGFVILDGQGRILDANAEYVRLSGHRELAEILGRSVIEWTTAHSLEKSKLALTSCSQGRIVHGLEIDHVGVDGKIISVEINATVEGTGDDLRIMSLCRDITERKQIEEVQNFLAQTSIGTKEEPFFNALALYLAQSLCMDFVCIDRLEGDGLTARTVAVWCDGHFEDNVTYALKDTPCGDVVSKTVCCFPANVCQFFPRDQVLLDLRAESYVGVTLFDHAGQPIGLIAVIGRTPLVNRSLAETTLKMVSMRVAGELERLEAAETLRASEKSLLEAQKIARLGRWELNLDTNHLMWSDGIYALFEVDRASFASSYEAFLEFIHPDDRDLVNHTYAESVKNKTPYEIEHRLIMKDGRIKWVSEIGRTEYDGSGHPIRSIGTVQDITGRKNAEDALHTSEKRYAMTLAAVNDGLWDWHVPSGKAFFSTLFYTLLGFDDGEFPATYASWRLLVHPDDIARVEHDIKKSVDTGMGFAIDLRMRKKIGEWLWVSTRGKTIELDADGKALRMVGTLSDITGRKLAEKRIVEKEEEIHLLLDSTAEAIYGLDMNGNCTFCNKACLRLLGYTHPGELLGKNMHWQIHSKHSDGSPFPIEDCPIFQAFKNGERVHADDEMFWHADGTSFHAEYWSFPQRKDGVIVGAVVTFLDISERKRMEDEKAKLEEQNRHLQKTESLGLMSGSIAHIFNNQLQVVMGYLEMAIDELPPNDSIASKLENSIQAAKKASEVSGNLLAYLGKKQVKLELFDLAGLCRMSLPVLQKEKPENVSLEIHLPSPGPCISADVRQLKQMLNNLVINAWESIGDGYGTIHLSVRTVSSADIQKSHRFPLEWQSREQLYACLEVKDSGCGIREEDMDKIFDPFFSTKFTGRGLGLSVVLGYARMHNAVITTESRINGGSVFKVFFPLSAQMPPRQNEPITKTPKIVQGGTVLLVEDEKALREMIKFALTSFGFTVLQAKDGIEAVEIFEKHKDEISCLLSDLTMPRMGGWETIAALRAIRHDLPVILASGYNEGSVMAGKHSELPDFFLNKPYDLHKLADAIGQAIARKQGGG